MQIANPSKEAKANAAKNPFGLVYEGAITKNEKGKVNIKSVTYTGSAPKKLSEEELAKISTDLYREGAMYYGDTHAHPNSTFAYTTSSLLDLMRFDVLNQIELIHQPLLMLVGDKADTAYMSEAAYKKAGSKDKRLHKLKNTTHIQSYYKKRSGGRGTRRA